MAGSVEHLSVLEGDAAVPAQFFKFPQIPSVRGAPAGAVREKHVGAFGFRQSNSLKMRPDIVNRIAYVPGQDPAQLIEPCFPFFRLGADQGMHGEHIHLIIVA